MNPRSPLRIATRSSALAREQAQRVADLLAAAVPGLAVELLTVNTEGDRDKTSPLTAIGGRGVFTSGVQEALHLGLAEIAVHSAKDLPSEQTPNLVIAAFPERLDPRDVLVSRHGVGLQHLPPNPRIGTSSQRRAAQVLSIRPDAVIVDLRGNIDTRLQKAHTDAYDAIVIAAAGLTRMGWDDAITEYLPLDVFVPSPGQGALAVEACADDHDTIALLASIDNPAVRAEVIAERAFLAAIGAGCTKPVGAIAEGGVLRVFAATEDLAQPTTVQHELVGGAAISVARGLAAQMTAATDSDPRIELAHERVLVTRPLDQAGPLMEAVIAAGGEAVVAPAISITLVAEHDPMFLAAQNRVHRGDVDWVLFTSANGVRSFVRGLDLAAVPASVRWGALGTATAAAMREHGIVPHTQATMASASGLAQAIGDGGVEGLRIIAPQGNLALARPDLAGNLRSAGAEVEVFEAYQTHVASEADFALVQRIREKPVTVVTLTSPSAVNGLLNLLDGSWDAVGTARVVCVGETTAQAARDARLGVSVVAAESSVPGLLDAIRRASRTAPTAAGT